MFVPQVDRVRSLYSGRFTITPSLQVDNRPPFSLDMSGVAGLLGGDDAVSAMTAVHVYGNRRWLGWYNTPGSFRIAKRFSLFAKSASLCDVFSRNLSSNSLSKSVYLDPATLFEPDGFNCRGPKFCAAHSGTVIKETGYLASLFARECTALDSEGTVVPGRRTQPVGITIVDLSHAPPSEMDPARSNAFALLAASVPIATSIGTCALCAAYEDWYASSLILVGIVASGVSCLVLGSADFVFTHPEPAKGSPAGDGILTSDKDIVLLRGTEGAVNSITRGRFFLRFSSAAHDNLLWWCSLLFFVQCITQLLLIPQASLFGQAMFLASLGVSALYNAWLSSLDKDKIHRKLLFERVLENPSLTKYTLGTRTTAVVFMLLVLQLQDPTKLLDEFLPNDTKVWKQWKTVISEQLRHPRDHSFLSESNLGDVDGFTQQEQQLLNLLYEDARAAYNGYKDYLGVKSL
ncbi:hypothetical protein L210DRAFT_3402134 [Boletus edulis BED1]|uniref:Uncharacterized protein n=1 Tax=Boletus edulis BED1 TaxID=1328754 RepID=A0AAD4BTW4_BOLED|nr:hypothetical protein L210DRAFT_3402134 [Boletus edulis BED1]